MTSPIPTPALGRGAWTKTAKLNGSVYYEYIPGMPLDGEQATLDVNFLAVNEGVKALQNECNARGWTPKLLVDGCLGADSKVAFQWLQSTHWNSPTGAIGSSFARFLWRRTIALVSNEVNMNPRYLWAMMIQESLGDPGAVGYTTPSDRGLFQINVVAHSDISPQQAHDPLFATRYTALRFKQEWDSHSANGSALQEIYAIAQHNSPASARLWYSSGTAPNAKILEYVTKTQSYMASW